MTKHTTPHRNIGLWLPVFCTGGVERYHLDLATAMGIHATDVSWNLCIEDQSRTHDETLNEAFHLMGYFDFDQLTEVSDVIVTWGIADLSPLIPYLQSGGKVVIVQHGDSTWSRMWMHGALRTIREHLDNVSFVAVSDMAADAVRNFGLEPTVLHAGIDANRIAPACSRETARRRLCLNPTDVAVGYVGRYSREKNPFMVANVVGHLGAGYKAIYHGHALGDQRAFEEEATRLAEGRIAFASRLERTGDIYSALDCLVIASPEEGGPLVALEAWLCGIPVISAPVGIVRQFPGWFECVRDAHDMKRFAIAVESISHQRYSFTAQANLHSIRCLASERFSLVSFSDRWAIFLREVMEC